MCGNTRHIHTTFNCNGDTVSNAVKENIYQCGSEMLFKSTWKATAIINFMVSSEAKHVADVIQSMILAIKRGDVDSAGAMTISALRTKEMKKDKKLVAGIVTCGSWRLTLI